MAEILSLCFFTYAQHHWHCDMVVLEEKETDMGNVATVAMHVGSLGILYIEPVFALQYHPPSMGIDYYGRRIAGFASGETQVSWVLLFAFLQSIHYLVWIRLIPEEDRPQKTPRGFEKSYRALEVDFGFGFLFVGFLTLVFFIGYAIYSPSLARADYLTLISFHGFLELVMLAYNKQERTDELDNNFSYSRKSLK